VRELVPPQWPKSLKKCKIAVVGEAPGENEALQGKPFIGKSGKLLDKALKEVGIKREDCLITNVFRRRPPDNDVKFFFQSRVAQKLHEKEGGEPSPYPFFTNHGWVKPEWQDEVNRLWFELKEAQPNIVLCMGATALWALTGQSKIGSYRGAVMESTLVPGLKVLATYHPAFIMRMWPNLPVMVADVKKAAEESEYPEIRRIEREIYIEPDLEDLDKFYFNHIRPLCGTETPLSYDIETVPDNITCIGFAPSDRVTLVVPFMDKRQRNWSYWPTLEAEQHAWNWVTHILEDSSINKVAQNGLYDIQWLYHCYGVKVRGVSDDTMLMHHSLQPELRKSLGFLGSLYSRERAWKELVDFKAEDKKDA
jgi:DNA polymerase